MFFFFWLKTMKKKDLFAVIKIAEKKALNNFYYILKQQDTSKVL